MSLEIEFEGGDYFALRFPYHHHFVRCVRSLTHRRWDPEQRCWHVHLSHLTEVMQIFQCSRADLPPKLWRAYQIYRIRTSRARLVVGNTFAYFEGERLPLEAIDEATTYAVPGHQYAPSYLERRWDGRRHLFDRRTLRFPAGLVARVCEVLDKHHVAYQIVPETEVPAASVSYRSPAFELRDYQHEAVEAALAAKRGVLELATGAGKTVIAARMISELGLPAIFFVHTRDLLHQTHAFFQEHLSRKVGIVGDGAVHLAPLTVATLQTVGRALGVAIAPQSDDEVPWEEDTTDIAHSKTRLVEYVRQCPVVFFDECHHVPAESFYALAMQTSGACYRFGLSATPYRADKLDLLMEAALGPKVFRANASTLIDKGYLVAPEIVMLSPPAYHAATSRSIDYATIFHEYIVTNPDRNRLIAQQASELAEAGKSVLVLVAHVAHGQRLAELLPQAQFVQGADSAAKRQRVFRRLEKKTYRIVIATTLADEGLDVPTLDAVILASGGKSETRTLQRIGRALRPAPGKDKALIIDFFDHAPFLKDHSLRRLQIYRTEPRFQVRTSGFSL